MQKIVDKVVDLIEAKEIASRITDKEIIERLTKIEERLTGVEERQKYILREMDKRFEAMERQIS